MKNDSSFMRKAREATKEIPELRETEREIFLKLAEEFEVHSHDTEMVLITALVMIVAIGKQLRNSNQRIEKLEGNIGVRFVGDAQ